MLGLTSCNDWLDVNDNPDSPTQKNIPVENRVPLIERNYMYSRGISNYRGSCSAGAWYTTNGNGSKATTTWDMADGWTTASYQTWFVMTASNLKDLYEKAEAEGAYHYMALADVYHAMGFMDMLDLYGEIPYNDALGDNLSPSYDDGKTIFNGCMAKLDEAIELFGRTQEVGATPLSKGDIMNGGDTGLWIKLCYGLKARYMLHLSKRKDLFKPDEILACLEKAMKNNSDNSIMPCYNSGTDVTEYLYGDPVQTNGNWNYAAYGATQRISKYHYDLLTNMRDAGVVDPRFTKIVPAIMTKITLKNNGTVNTYEWLRSEPVDIMGEAERIVAGGATSVIAPSWATKDTEKIYTIKNDAERADFASKAALNHEVTVDGNEVKVKYAKNSLYINSTNYITAGDTVYVSLRQNSMLTGNGSLNERDLNWYVDASARNAGVVASTGSFQLRPISGFEVMTYPEVCFIKAEVLFRKGNKAGAYEAYKAGIQAHLDYMQAVLKDYEASKYDNPDMMPMDNAEITAYMSSNAVCQSAGELTMSDIMLQKYITMGCSLENWTDMRRFNFSAGNVGEFGVVYPNFDRSKLFTGGSKIVGKTKTDPQYWVRRWKLPATLELSYNETSAKAANKYAADPCIWSIPVWWDCETDAQYENYIH